MLRRINNSLLLLYNGKMQYVELLQTCRRFGDYRNVYPAVSICSFSIMLCRYPSSKINRRN